MMMMMITAGRVSASLSLMLVLLTLGLQWMHLDLLGRCERLIMSACQISASLSLVLWVRWDRLGRYERLMMMSAHRISKSEPLISVLFNLMMRL